MKIAFLNFIRNLLKISLLDLLELEANPLDLFVMNHMFLLSFCCRLYYSRFMSISFFHYFCDFGYRFLSLRPISTSSCFFLFFAFFLLHFFPPCAVPGSFHCPDPYSRAHAFT